jgi:hypothetical protein
LLQLVAEIGQWLARLVQYGDDIYGHCGRREQARQHVGVDAPSLRN